MLKKYIKKAFARQTVISRLSRLIKKPAVIVLAYHNVGSDNTLGSWLQIAQRNFDEQLGTLAKFCHFIRPEDLFEGPALLPDRPNLLVTFDDGYGGNCRYALPVLEKHGIPALFFISTANMQSGELFWFDKLIIPIQAQHLDYLDLRATGLSEYRFRSNGDRNRR
jgi:hypothetical protein